MGFFSRQKRQVHIRHSGNKHGNAKTTQTLNKKGKDIVRKA